MKKIFNRKNSTILAVTLAVLLSFVILGNTVNAGVDEWAISLVGGIARLIVSVLGWILVKLMAILIYVAQYSNFIDAPVVQKGWVLARDVANMFFIVILLIISFATILRVEKYNYKKWLPKLILMAILINFSKTISGLLIDVSQVIMLTFVNAFKAIGAGSLTDMLGMKDWQSLQDAREIKGWEVVAAYVLAVVYAFIALATIAAMVAMLVMRIIMIWVYVVLSPFAYLLAAFPDGASYSSRWWSEFSKNLIIGPVLAFFIWLSFAALGTGGNQALGTFKDADNNFKSTGCEAGDKACIEYGSSGLMIQFIVSIAMLLGGMKIAQEIGGAGGAVAGKTFGKVKGAGMAGLGLAGGALGAASGYTFAKRRVSSWRQDLKKSSQQKADLRYEKVKGKTKGIGAGVASGVKRTILPKQSEEKKKRQHADKEEKYKEKQRQKEIKEARYEAYQTGTYIDPSSGKEYRNYDKKSKTYKDDAGLEAKDSNKNAIKRMSHFSHAFKEEYRDNTTKAKALKNQMSDEKMSAKQKLYESAGTSAIDLKRIMQDGSASKDKRMAAAIELAIKEGFKNKDLQKGRQEVSEAKRVLGDNQPLLNKFDEKINKRFAALNFDVGTQSGNNEYKAALADGRVDGYKQDASTYDTESAKVLRDYSGKDFGKKYGDMMSQSKAHFEAGINSLRGAKIEALQNKEKIHNSATGEMNPYAKLLAKNGDIEGAFNNSTNPDTLNFDNQSVDAFKEFLATASAKDLKNMNNDYFDESKLTSLLGKKDIAASASEVKNMKLRIEKTIAQNIDIQKVSSLEYSDENPEFVRRVIGLVKKHGSEDRNEEIEKNNVLKNIKPIK